MVSAWVKITSYAAGEILSRFNGTSGWQMGIESNGQLSLFGYNASGANYSGITSYQSLPLNKWVHVAIQLDMSSFSNSSTTSYCMIDGINVARCSVEGQDKPTSLINNVGNLEIGSANGGGRRRSQAKSPK